jgi:glycosyltransferase involved in cell wall biosynthesis
LLENIDGLKDMTFGYTPFEKLAKKIERKLLFSINKPKYLIRNATFFRPIKTKIPQICLLQDFYNEQFFIENQLPVINSCSVSVINSPHVYNQIRQYLSNQRVEIIPMGVDFDFFNPEVLIKEEVEVSANSILFVGSSSVWPKGFDFLMELVEGSNYNFVFVMKDDFQIAHPRIKVFNKINQTTLKVIMKKCRIMICTSQMETFHLAGVEGCAMNLPIVTTEVGIYKTLSENGWGLKSNKEEFLKNIDFVFNNIKSFSPRKAMLENGLSKKQCMEKWRSLIQQF